MSNDALAVAEAIDEVAFELREKARQQRYEVDRDTLFAVAEAFSTLSVRILLKQRTALDTARSPGKENDK